MKVITFSYRALVFLLFLIFPQSYFAQQAKIIENYIQQDSLRKAKTLLDKTLREYKTSSHYDSLYKMIQFVGNPLLNNGNKDRALKNAFLLTEEIKNMASPHYVVEAITEYAWLYADMGQPLKAYEIIESAVPYAKDPNSTDLANIYYRMGYYASNMGDYMKAKRNYQRSLKLLQKSKQPDYVFYNQVYNALGGMMWQESKLDSAQFYYQEAVKVLEKTDESDIMNRYFRPSLIKLNLCVLLNALGKNQQAIAASEEAVKGFQDFINRSDDPTAIKKAKRNLCMVLDNMASFYNTLGEYYRAQELLERSYEMKKDLYEPNDINLAISEIIIAEAKTANRDFKEAAKNADAALKILGNSAGADLYWESAALSARATIYEEMDDMENAEKCYDRSNHIYRRSMEGTYNKDFMVFLAEQAIFSAKYNKREKALSLAKEVYTISKTGEYKNTLQEYNNIVILAKVNFILKDYKEAQKYSEEALSFHLSGAGGTADSILNQYQKPQALYINTKSRYYLSKEKNVAFLKSLLQQVNQGLAILDQRKLVVNSPEDVSLLITENEELIDFAEQLRLELYQQTKDEAYLERLIALHESSIYNKIRSRLNLRDNISFSHIPEKVVERESTLKKNLTSSLDTSEEKNLNIYLKAVKDWEVFLDSMKLKYPKYYKLRYATFEESLEDLQKKISSNTTIVRYLFIENELYAFVISASKKHMIALDYQPVKNHIQKLNEVMFNDKKAGRLLFELYKSIWLPLAPEVQTQKVVIVPDRELFNLSFDILISEPIEDFKEMAQKSLLSKYSISYNFSLILLKDRRKVVDYNSEFVAFAPGFSDEMKENYKVALTEPTKLDKNYLQLLPQPFSENLVKRYAKVFDGDYFINENASKPLFLSHAKEHKIIHIGTHAENNNVNPELSRLIFAKNLDTTGEFGNNSLYSYEIYNTDLSSNLAVLTACETGKPSYRSGEGMISLAHAFTYAGSESILTSLWEIDEKATTEITELFYDHLADGLPKDEALRKAKLDFLGKAEGRTLSPHYWAGLVLIGDTTPIDLRNELLMRWGLWIALGIILLLIILLLIRMRRRRKI